MAQQSIARQGGISMTLSVQYVELYQSDLSDLTTGKPVRLRDTGSDPFRFLLQGSAEHQVKSLEGFLAVLQQGEVRKQFAETAMNGRSSRAHTCVLFALFCFVHGVASLLHLTFEFSTCNMYCTHGNLCQEASCTLDPSR